MKLLPLGDQAVMAYLDDEASALRFAGRVRRAQFPWLMDIVQAYTSVAVYYSLENSDYWRALAELQTLGQDSAQAVAEEGRLFSIPCCYEMGLDLQRVADHTGLGAEEVIRLHTSTVYTVYAIGFCPGFPYLGYLPNELSGVPRLPAPRLRVEAGSVGLTGRQTGIYTEPRPGGWNILGRTPLELVNVTDGYFPLRTGDRVQFIRIDDLEFKKLTGQRI